MNTRLIIIFLFSVIFYSENCAQNLVPVSQFERADTSICPPPLIVGVSSDLFPWFTFASPDYFNVCDTSNYVSVPQNFIGYQQSYSGRGYIGLLAYASPNSREYVEAPLLSSLIIGQMYYVQFYVCLGDISRYAIENMGMLFTDTIYDPTYYITNNLSVYPQIVGNTMITDSINWVSVSGSFIASGGEQYVTIGNFYNDTETIKLYLGGSGPVNLEAYYFIEDVYVGTTPPPVGIHENSKDAHNMKLYPNPSNGNMTLECNLNEHEAGAVFIYDLSGKLVHKYFLSSGAKTISIDAKILKPGTYVYEIIVNDKKVKRDKLTVIK